MPDSAFGGKRVRLRAIEPEDWETFYAWNQDSEAARGMYLTQFPQSKAAVREWASATATRPAGARPFLLCDREPGGRDRRLDQHT